ncbi:MAG: DivIVA domain-containing protein [Nitrospirae bacterium]|nr:DivIVA domain-containing protein [Nitrospirota bacterium]
MERRSKEMTRINPEDILRKRFSARFRGASRKKVLEFLDTTSLMLRDALVENMDLRERLKASADTLKERKDESNLVIDKLTVSIQEAKHMRSEALNRAFQIMAQTDEKVERMIAKAQLESIKIHEDIDQARILKLHFQNELDMLVGNHLEMIEHVITGKGE